VRGTHAAGADLAYTCIAPNQYRVTLSVYRDCRGIALANSQTVLWTATGGGCSGSINMTRTSITDITPLPTTVLSSCAGGSAGTIGLEKHVFQAVLTVPPGCTNILFSYAYCCRNNAITTLTHPRSENIYVNSLVNTVLPCNNSPIISNVPILYSCVNQLVQYNPSVYDIDGDSLSYALVNCLEANNNFVEYAAGYSGTNFLGAGVPISLNPVTGDLSFTPITAVATPICIRINEYRNGVLIGYVIRDVQYRAIN